VRSTGDKEQAMSKTVRAMWITVGTVTAAKAMPEDVRRAKRARILGNPKAQAEAIRRAEQKMTRHCRKMERGGYDR
jgi:hypothetical protein